MKSTTMRKWIVVILLAIVVYCIYLAFHYFTNEPYRRHAAIPAQTKAFDNNNRGDTVKRYGDLDQQKQVKNCFLVIDDNGKFTSLYTVLKANNNNLQQFQHDFHQLRLVCIHTATQAISNALLLQEIGVKSVSYQLVKGKLIATGVLLDGSTTPLYVAPAAFLKGKDLPTRSNGDSLPKIE